MRLATLIEQFEADFLTHYGDRALPGARRALSAMKHCRDTAAPHLLAGCAQGQASVLIPHSCRCPHCQHHDSAQWVHRHCQRLLPVDYILVTFTQPRSLRPLAWAHQHPIYGAMLHCAWQCLAQFARNDATLGVHIGATAVLHTRSRRCDYHPHVHLVVPASGVDTTHNRWRRKHRHLFNARNFATVFRAKLLAALDATGLTRPHDIEPRWIVDCRNVGRGGQTFGYLARYLYRGVLSERDILSCHDGNVTFRYTESKSKQPKTRTLPGAEFLWLLVQHVLPKGFHRARDYGLLHHKRNSLLSRVQYVLRVKLPPPAPPRRPAVRCPSCGASMRILGTRLPSNAATNFDPLTQLVGAPPM